MRVKVGDILEIPLPNNKFGFAQFVCKDEKWTDLIRVFDYFIDQGQSPDFDVLKEAKFLFPPVYTSVRSGVKTGYWRIIGNIPVENFTFPKFISTFYYLTGRSGVWFLYDGQKDTRIGMNLPEEYKQFEFSQAYSPNLIVERIMTGEKPMEELINTGKIEAKISK